MKYFLFIIVLSSLFLVSCDDRGYQSPTMDISIDLQQGYTVYNKAGFNELTFYFQLDGPLSKIRNRRINVNITNNIGNFIGTGTNQSVLTNDLGYAEGRYIAGSGYGIANIEFVLETWPSENKTVNVQIIDFPKIDSLVAGTYILNADGVSSTSLTAYISSANAELEKIKILFEASEGTLTQTEVFADEMGIATSNFIAPNQEANVTVKAKLALQPTSYKSVSIKCQNP